VGFGTQHAVHMRHIVIYGLPGCAVFFHISHQRHDFLKKVIDHKMFVLIFSTTFVLYVFILRRIERDMIKVCNGLHVKYPLFLSGFIETRIFWTDFRKILIYEIS